MPPLVALLALLAASDPTPASAMPAAAPASPSPGPASPAPAPSWSSVEKEHITSCTLPFGTRAAPITRRIGDVDYSLSGARLSRAMPSSGELVIGILSAIKDAEPDTRANLRRAAGRFREAGVDLLVVNGDIALQQFDLEDIFAELGQMGFATGVLIGNSESRGAFNRAFVGAEKKYPNLFNLNWVREVEVGPYVLVSMPGYVDRAFVGQSSSCVYRDRDLRALATRLDALQGEKKIAILVSHGPPRSKGPRAIDRAFEAGNVGDPKMAQIMSDNDVRFGLFGHILEAGGRASLDLPRGRWAKAGAWHPRLYVNAGSASATPWTLHGGRASTGMAMIVRIGPQGARYQVLTLSR